MISVIAHWVFVFVFVLCYCNSWISSCYWICPKGDPHGDAHGSGGRECQQNWFWPTSSNNPLCQSHSLCSGIIQWSEKLDRWVGGESWGRRDRGRGGEHVWPLWNGFWNCCLAWDTRGRNPRSEKEQIQWRIHDNCLKVLCIVVFAIKWHFSLGPLRKTFSNSWTLLGSTIKLVKESREVYSPVHLLGCCRPQGTWGWGSQPGASSCPPPPWHGWTMQKIS